MYLILAVVLGLVLAALSDIWQSRPVQAQSPITSTITIRTNQTSVHEGGRATFILERYGGGTAPLMVQVKTWEPNLAVGEDNPSEQVHEVRFRRGDRRLLLNAVPFVDGTTESGTQTLNAQVLASGDSSYQVGSANTASITILDPPSDNSVAVINVTRDSNQSSVAEGETITYTFTRAGGDTTQPLTIDIEVSDPSDFLRGDFWDPPPVLPTQIQFGAGSASETLDLTVPDDRRHLYLDGVTVTVLPSADYLLKFYGEDHGTSAVVYVNDSDIAQQLELNFGKDGTNDADVEEGDTLKLVVKRRQRDADTSQTASFTVRVETDRGGPDHVLDDWETDSSTNKLYKDFPLEITGSDTEVEQAIEVTVNGEQEDDWVYKASILPIEDHEGKALTDSQEAQYWTVKSGFRETEVAAADGGDNSGTVTIATRTTAVLEGGGVTYTLTRAGGPIGRSATVDVRTWEPSRRSGGTNPSDQTTNVQFDAWETTATFTISAYVDGEEETGTDALKAKIDSASAGYTTGTPGEVDVEINDPPANTALITMARDQPSIAEGQTGTFTLTRTGGDTTQELTVNLRVDDNGDYLRGNQWDPAPDLPTEATFAANSTTKTISLTAPDDDRDLPDAGLITLSVLPGTGYLLGNTGTETKATVSTTDNDTAQQLSLNWGYLDPTDSSWEDGESYAPCIFNNGKIECTAGPAEGFYYYDDDRNFQFSHEFEEPWPIHFEVSRRAQDVGSTATFVVRVEHNRGWESLRHADWPVDPETGKYYQEFSLTLTGDQRKVIGRIEILDNGERDRNWKYTATIKQLEDINGDPVTADQENDYWTVQGDRTQTLTKAGEVPFPEFKIELTDPRMVEEGSQYTFSVKRKWGNAHEPLPVQIRTWEPNRTNPDGTNPTAQVHNLTFPAVPVTSYFRTTLEQTLDVTVTASDDAMFETSDLLKIELLTPAKRRVTSVVKGQVAIIDDDQPTIELKADKDSYTEGEAVTFTLTRGNNSSGELIVGIQVDDPGKFLQGDYPGDADGVETPTSVTFADGEATKTVTIALPDDRRDIPDSDLTFTVGESPAYEILGTNPQTVQLADNDVAPQVQISFNHEEVNEGEDLILIVKRIGEVKNDLEIPMTGGRVDDQRFTVIGLDPGQSEAHLRYRLPDDDVKNPDVEYSFTLEPENLEYWTPTGNTTVTAKIVDDDPYRVSVRALTTTVNEGGNIYYRVTHDGHTGEALQVKVNHSEIGSAVGDNILGERSYTFNVGESGITRAYYSHANDGSDGNATFTVDLVASDEYEINPDRASASVTVVDLDPLPVLRFQNFLVEVREGVGTAEHTVELISDLPVLRDVTVEYQVQEKFISDGADITESTGTLTIPAGETTGVIEIPIIQDSLAESDELFFVYLRNPTHTTLQYGVSSLRGWGLILDDEPTVTIETSLSAIIEGADAVFTLTRDEDTSEELTVWVQVVQSAPVRENVQETVVFAAGDDTATLTIATENYRAPRGVAMTISATLLDPPDVGEPKTYGLGTTGPVLITVRDVSLPDVSVSAEDPWIVEGSTATFTFQRQNGEWRRITIDIEVVADSRFVSSTLPTTITFPLNASSVTLEIETDSDTTAEDNGEITVTVKDGTGYEPRFPSTVTTTVFDDDSGFPDIRVTKSADWVNEGDDVSFTFSRTGATTDPLDFKVSLWRMRHRVTQADLDDPTRHVTTPSSIMPFDQEDLSLTFAAGDSSLVITRSTTDDVLNSGNSSYHARVESGADSVYTTAADYTELVWVQDDDRPTVTMAPATQEYVGSIPISGLVSIIRPEATLTRTGDATGNLSTDTHHERTRHIPPPEPDIVVSGDQFGSFREGNSSQAALVSTHLYVNFMGWSGIYSFASPHYCPDEPEVCRYRPQYVLGTDTEMAYRVYGALMGVRIEADQTSFDEGDAATFTLHRLGGKKDAMDRPLQVRVAVTQEGDYISGTTPVTVDFAAGQSTATLTVPTTDDAVDEANGTIRAEILYPTSYADDEYAYEIRKYPDTPWFTDYFATTEIDDDDFILPNVSVADATGKEQDGTIEFTISLDGVNDEEQVTVNWATAEDGTDTAATSGTDFTADSGTVTFDIGETEKTVTVTLLDDEIDEAHETFNLVISSPSGASLGDDTASGTILDDELAVAVIFSSASGNVVEGENLSFTVKRLPPLDPGETLDGINPCDSVRTLANCFNFNPTAGDFPNALTIKVRVTQEGNVISGTTPTTVTFQAGSVFATFVVSTDDDSTVEANSVVTAKVLNGSGYSPFSVGLALDPEDLLPAVVRTVYDNDLTFSIFDASATEGSGSKLDFAVSLNAPAPQEVTVYAATVDGNATSHDNVTANSLGQDFTAKSETITFARGDQVKTFSVDVVGDTFYEMDETFSVQLSSPSHHSTIVDGTGLGTIIDDEAPMEASVSRAYSVVSEGLVGPARFVVTLSHPDTTNHERNPVVAWQTTEGTAAGGEDYVAATGRVTFNTGETTGFIDVNVIDDNLIEAELETFSVELLQADSRLVTLSTTDASFETSIRDNETLTASISANAKAVVEGQVAVFTVRLRGGVTVTDTKITFEVSESDSSKTYVDTDDYGTPIGNLSFPEDDDTGSSGTLRIPAGESSGTITYPITVDSEDESDPVEHMELRLFTVYDGLRSSGVSQSQYKASTKILDGGSLTVSIGSGPTVTEGGTATFTITLSNTSASPESVGWTTKAVGDALDAGETADPGTDYSTASGTVQFSAGSTSGTFTVQTTDDSLVEDSETFIVTLTEDSVPLGTYYATGTITDNDVASDGVTVSATPRRVAEDAGATDLSVTVSLNGTAQFTTDTAVTLKFFGRTATEGEDFTAPDVDVVIPAGESSVTTTVAFTVIEDNQLEANETVRLSAVPSTLANSDFVTITIDENDVSPAVVTLSITPVEADESAQDVSIEVAAEFDGTTTLSVDTEVEVTTGEDTATSGEDFETSTTTVIIPAGERRATATLSLKVLDDSLDEVDETLMVTGRVTNLVGQTVRPTTFTILDNDTAPTSIGLSVTSDAITEDGGAVTLTVRATLLGGGTRLENTTVALSLVELTASATDDYSSAWGNASLTIPAGQSYGETTLTITPVQDTLSEGDETIGVRGNNTDPGLSVNSVLLTIQDDDPAPTVVVLSIDPGTLSESVGSTFADVTATIGGNSTLTEDTQVTVGLDLTGSAVRSTLFSSLVILAGERSAKSSLLLTNLNDDVDDDDETLELTGTTNNPELTVSPAELVVTDDDTAGITISPNSLVVMEGGLSRDYTIKLDSQPTSDVTVTVVLPPNVSFTVSPGSVTFTPQNWLPKPISVTATEDENVTDEPAAIISHSVSSSDSLYRNAAAGSVSVTVRDDDQSIGVTISETSLTIEEGATDTYTVALGSQPAGDVTVTIGGHADTDVSLDKTILTFTDQDWNTAQTVTVTAEEDGDIDDEDDVTLTHTVTSADDSDYDGTSADSVTVSIKDVDEVGVTVIESTLELEEGAEGTYTVVLDSEPDGDVIVTIAGYAGTDVSLDKTALTFTDQNWDRPKTVTVTAEHDGDDEDEDDVTLTHTVTSADDSDYDGISADSVTVSVTDDDTEGVAVYPTAVTVPEGNTAHYTVVLGTQPTGDVTVTIRDPTDNTDVTASPASLTFTDQDWDSPQLVTVSATADSDSDEDSATITHTVSGYGSVTTADDVAVTVTEDARVNVVIKHETQRHTVREGRTKAIEVVLDVDPERTLVIALSGDPVRGASSDDYSIPDFVVFSPGETEQSYIFTAVDDTVDDDDERVNVGFTDLPSGVSVGIPRRAFVDIGDNDKPEIVEVSINYATLDLREGNSVTLGLVLNEPAERNISVSLAWEFLGGASIADTGGLQHSVAFGPAHLTTGFSFSLGQDRIDERGEGLRLTFGELPDGVIAGTPGELIITFLDDDDAGVIVSPTSLTVAEGEDSEYTVVLNSQPTARVTVTIDGTSDTDLTLNSSTLTFTTSNWNSAKTVTVSAGQDDDADAETITLTHTVTSRDTIYEDISAEDVVVSVTDPDPGVKISKTALTIVEGSSDTYAVVLNTQPTSDVTVTIAGHASTDASLDKTTLTFTDLDWDTAQTVTVSAASDSDTNDEDNVTLTHTVASSDGDYDGFSAADVTVSITDDDGTSVRVAFGAASYSVDESDDSNTPGTEYEVVVTITLSADPERTVTIPIVKANQGGASDSDYTGVPASVVFNSGDTTKTFTFAATADSVDDDGESVKLTFGTLPAGVTEGTIKETTISINDDDVTAVTVSFGAATYSVDETDDASTTETKENEVVVTVTLSEDPKRTVTIPISKNDLGGASSSDYSGVPATLTFNSGDTSKTFTFAATADSVDDDGESVKLTFGTTLPTGVTEGATKETVISIVDDDVPPVTVSFGAGTYSVDESDDTSTTEANENEAAITVTLSADPERTVTIPISKTNQGGASSADYSGVPASVVFNAGETSKTFTFAATADSVDDDGESVKLTFGTTLPTGVTEGATKETVISITDDDVPSVTVSFGAGSYSVDESDDTSTTEANENEVTVTVMLSADPERTVTIPISKANQDGASNSDYSGVPASVVFNAGETSKTFTFAATSDSLDDDGESVKLSFGTLPTGVTEGTTKETVISITDDDVPSVSVAFGAGTYSVDESDDTSTTEANENEVTITVTLSADPERTVTIPINKGNQGGASSADYSGVPASVEFNSGETSKTFTFAATADSVDDDGESVKLTFSTLPTRVTEGATNETIVSINDDDLPADVDVAFGQGSYTVAEGNTVTVTVTLSEDPERTVTIPISKADQGGASSSDYSGVPASVVFNAGETSKTFTFAATSDSEDDDGESVKLTFGTTLPTGVTEGTTKETVISISDDDVPSVTVSFGAGSYSVDETDDTSTTEANENEATITVTLSADPERTVTIPISKANQGGASSSDYSGVPANVVFNAGETSKTFTFTATADSVDDDGESVKLTFGTTLPTGVTEGTTKETVISIADDDVPSVTVSFGAGSYSVDETDDTSTTEANENEATITVTLSADPERAVTIPISKADQGGASSSDYSGVPASVVFNAGETSKTFTFAATADSVDDDGESVKLTFTNLPTRVTEGTTKETTISIADDDVPSVRVAFGTASYSVDESDDSNTPGTEYEVVVTITLSADPERTVTIPIVKANQGGASDSDYTGVPASVVFNSGDTTKTFTFAATADSVDDDGESVKLTFGTLPAGVTEGTIKETTISINDDDVTAVTVSFGAATYSVDESDDASTTETKENEVVVTVTLSEDPKRTVTIPISKNDLGGASSSDYSGVPATLTFNSGDTSKTFTFAATADSVDDDGESVKLTFGTTLPTGVTEGTTKETIISIADDDLPSDIDVEFEQGSYSVAEGSSVMVKVTLSNDPERTVTIPIENVNQGSTSDSDYSGVPASVTFNSGETEKTFVFSATTDNLEDSGESVKLTFGTTLPTGVTEGTTKEALVTITNVSAQNSLTLNFGSSSYNVSEGGTTTIKVTLNTTPGSDTVIPLTKTNQGGASSADYSGVPDSITFGGSDTEKTFTFAATSDSLDDDGESVKLSFGTLPTGVTEGTTNETTVSITDDDVPSVTVSFGAGSYSVDETDDTSTTEANESEVTVTVTLSADPERTVTIPISKANQDGASNSDYSGVPASVVFNAGETSKTFTFAATADSLDDDGESVKLSFGTLPTGVTEGTTKETVISIADDDVPSVSVAFGAGTYSVDETDDANTTEDKENEVTVTVTLSADPERTVTIPISKANQDGASNSDYSGVPTNLTFNSGETSKTFTFAATADSVDDDGESVKLTFGNLPTRVTEGATNETIVSINDDDLPADVDVAFGQGSYAVAEGSTVTVTVTLSEDPERTVTIPISKANQDGASNSDYSGVPANVVFNAGETSKSFSFAATSDSLDDDGESVKLSFGTLPTGVTEGTTNETTVSITDDDVPSVSVSFGAGSYSVDETDDANTTEDKENEVTVTVTLSADPERTVTIELSKANQGGASSSDYSGVPASVVFNAGETSKTFTFAATADSVDDDGESVKLTFGTLPTRVTEGATNETTISINDDDLPADVDVEFGEGSYTAAEGSTVTVTVTLSADPERTVTIPISKADQGGASSSDYSGVPASVVFNAGETSKTFTFTAAADSVDDDGESVKLTFTNLPTGVTEGTTKETIISIADDDVPSVSVAFGAGTYSVDETDDANTTEDKENEVTVTVTLSADPERTVTIPISKANQDGASNSDYSGVPASVEFNSGETSKTFTFAATADSVDDDGESVKLTFGTLPTRVTEGATNETTISINDDDLPADVDVEFGEGSYTAAEGSTVTVTVTLSEDPERTVTIPISKANQGGASSSDYSGVPASVVFNAGETSKTFTFTATADSLNDDGESVKLTFTNLPTGVTEGATNETTVYITDDDIPSVSVAFGAGTYSVDETDDANTTEDKENEVTVTVTLSADPERTVTIPINKANQGGASSSDYSGVPASVVFNAGETSKTFTFAATADTVDDDGESVKLTFTNLPTGVTEGTTDEAVVSINDDDLPADVDVAFGEGSYTVAEGSTVTVTVTLSEDPERTVTIPISKANQDGASNSDYSGVPAIVVFNAGETSKSFSFAATSDSLDDDGESVKLSFGTLPTGVTEGTTKETIISIADDDVPSVSVAFGAGTYSVDETDDANTTEDKENEVTVTVTLSADPERTVTIPISRANQDGASNSDYSGVPASVEFNSGETSKTFTFAATADSVDDDGESVKLTFGTLPTRVTEGATNETTISINDDDLPADVDVAFGEGSYTVAEGSTVTVTVTLSADPERTVTIPISKANQGGASSSDYSGVPASVVFNAGETSKTFTFAATADTVDDDGESVKLTFTNLPTGVTEGTTKETTISIADDDVPSVTVSFGAGSYSVEETDDASTTEDKENEVTVTVTLSADPERTVTIELSKADQGGASSSDYSGVPASVVFNAGETSKTFIFAATADTVDDDGESVKLTFSNLPAGVTEGTTKEAVVSINDDDDPTIMQVSVTVSFNSFDYSLMEGSTVIISVRLSEDPERTVTIPVITTYGAGASASDHSGVPDNIVFNSGVTEKSFYFSATQDSHDEDEETVILGFGEMPSGVSTANPTQAAIYIRDSLRVSFGASSYQAHEGGDDATIVVRLDEAASVPTTIPIDLTLINGVTSDDFDSVPSNVVFAVGERSKSFTVTALEDDVEDGGEMIGLGFGDLPAGVAAGSPSTTTVELMNKTVERIVEPIKEEIETVQSQCPDDSGRRIILDSQGEITETNVSQFWRIRLDPYRTYLIEVFGSSSQTDLSGDELPNETRTLPNPKVISAQKGDHSEKITHTPIGNAIDLLRGSDATGWHQIEVSGMGETGTYRIRVRVNNVCVDSNNKANYRYFGGPDGYVLDIPADSKTTRVLGTSHVSTESFLGDNWSWYWDREPDVDWFEAGSLKMDQEYSIVAWAADDFPSSDQVTDLKIVGVYDSAGSLISGTTSTSTGERVSISFKPVSDGTYYIAVGSGSGDRTGVYKLKIE